MGEIVEKLEELIGKTPLMELNNVEEKEKCKAHLLAKLEYFNPAGSIKDRAALSMIQEARDSGKLVEGGTIVEPTSGNTGIGLAALSAAMGYHAIFTMPDTMSLERQKLLKAYGANIVLTPGKEGMKGAIKKAQELCRQIPNSFLPGQFDNQANPAAHERTTGPEIWEAVHGKIDYLVASVGTGGTITGLGRYLKSKNPKLQVIAVEPADSPVLSGGTAGPHKLQGIGAGFVPSVLDIEVYQEVIPVTTKQAYEMVREIAGKEGVLIGISSGAAAYAALEVGRRQEAAGKNIVVIFPDGGDRYLSTDLFDE